MLDDKQHKVKQNTEGGIEVVERGEFVLLAILNVGQIYPSCEGDISLKTWKEV